jgi:hypothetical protein
MSAQEKSRDFSAEPHLPYMEGEDYRLCNACKQPAGASIHLRRDSRQCQAFYPLHGRPCPNMAVDADPNDGERALCADCLKNANGAPWTPWSEGYYHSDNGSWEPRGDYTHWVPKKAKAKREHDDGERGECTVCVVGDAAAKAAAPEHVCVAFVGGLCPVCNGKNPAPPIQPEEGEADREGAQEEEALRDNTTLHAIQMAYSAMERALAVPAVKGVRPGLVEVEQWLSDAKSYVASLRDTDRQLHEAQVAFEEEALLSKPKF